MESIHFVFWCLDSVRIVDVLCHTYGQGPGFDTSPQQEGREEERREGKKRGEVRGAEVIIGVGKGGESEMERRVVPMIPSSHCSLPSTLCDSQLPRPECANSLELNSSSPSVFASGFPPLPSFSDLSGVGMEPQGLALAWQTLPLNITPDFQFLSMFWEILRNSLF